MDVTFIRLNLIILLRVGGLFVIVLFWLKDYLVVWL